MSRVCQVCRKNSYKDSDVTFHVFPRNLTRRQIWFALLGFEAEKVLPKSSFICSNHFVQTDFHYKSNGIKYLNTDANPQPCNFEVFEARLSSDVESESTIGSFGDGSPTRKALVLPDFKGLQHSPTTSDISSSSSKISSVYSTQGSRVLPIGALNVTENLQAAEPCIAGPSGINSKLHCNSDKISHGSSSTLTASEAEVEEQNQSNNSDDILKHQTSKRKAPSRLVSKTKKRKCYIGDLTSSDFGSPKRRSANLSKVKQKVQQQAKKIRSLQTANKKLRSKIKSLNDLIKHMRGNSMISENTESSIRASLAGPSLEIFEKMLKGPNRQAYNDELKCFALTLAFYSPKAYNFVRETFNKSLPHLKTLSRWFQSVDGAPGFTREALTALKIKCNENKNEKVLCNLVMDEMSIRKMVEWTGTKFTGHVNIGLNLESDLLPEAREALVFMLVALNGSWKVSVGYFFLNGITASEKAVLVNRCLEFIHESGVTVTGLTCDGAATNLAMMERLGLDFSNPENLKTSFLHPVTGEKVFVFLDACHMLKLIRNCFGVYNLQNEGGGFIKWKYISNLVEIQSKEGLNAATKLKLRHLEWQREKMKVRLAAQVLSKSVSDALIFLCEELKIDEFQGCIPTAEFILKINNIFDILNSRNYFGKYFFKRPLSPKTFGDMKKCMDELANYIIKLKLDGIPVLKSRRKTGFLGLLICMRSLKDLYHLYVEEKKLLKYILSYKLSQDHLELFFGAIRSKGGFNNNPSARQFEAAYKRLLVHTEVSGPNTGNAVNLEKHSILCGGSGAQKVSAADSQINLQETESYKKFEKEMLEKMIKFEYLTSDTWHLTDYVRDIVSYIAGFVIKGLKKCVACCKCLALLQSTDDSLSRLQKIKTYGALNKASSLMISICQVAEKFFRFYIKTTNIYRQGQNMLLYLVTKAKSLLPGHLYNEFGDHLFDDDPIDGHIQEIVKLILKNYFKIRIYHEVNKKVDTTSTNRVRSINSKIILFKNQ